MNRSRRRLRFGLAFDYFDPSVPIEQTFEIMLRLTAEARDAGFDLIYHPQHFLDSEHTRFQPLPAVSRLAAEAQDMLIVFADIVPLNHPVRVAEELATLDVISGGRAILLAVLGYQRSEFTAFGVELSERAERMRAFYEILCRLLSGRAVSYPGPYYPLNDVELGGLLHPVALPRPPIWVTGHNDAGVRRAALHGDVWFISHQPTFSELVSQVTRYEAVRSEREVSDFHAFADHGIRRPILREAFVATSNKEALSLAAEPMMASVGEYLRSDQLSALNDPSSYRLPFDEWRNERALLGDPKGVADELERYQKELGIDCIVLKLHRSGIAFNRILESIRLTGAEIIPRFST